jgi:hypothetical protein
MILPTIRTTTLVAVATTALACYGGDSGPKVPLGQVASTDSIKRAEAAHAIIGPAAKAALDSGNALFRKKAYAPALAQYRAAGDLAPQHAAPLFGVYMVARATNDSKLADSALVEIKKRNGPLPAETHDLNDPGLKAIHKKIGTKSASGG